MNPCRRLNVHEFDDPVGEQREVEEAKQGGEEVCWEERRVGERGGEGGGGEVDEGGGEGGEVGLAVLGGGRVEESGAREGGEVHGDASVRGGGGGVGPAGDEGCESGG